MVEKLGKKNKLRKFDFLNLACLKAIYIAMNATGVDVVKYSTKKLADKCTAQLKAEMQEPICVDYNVSRELLTVTCGYSLKNIYGITVV